MGFESVFSDAYDNQNELEASANKENHIGFSEFLTTLDKVLGLSLQMYCWKPAMN